LRWTFNGKRAMAAASREEIKDAFEIPEPMRKALGDAESDPGEEMPMVNIEACPVRNAWIVFR
jgi:hypothetical protein